MTFNEILYLAALIVFSFGCRTFDNRWLQKLGWFGLLAASYLFGWWITDSHVAGACAVLVWFLLPWLEIVTRVRKLRFPIRNEIKHRFPPSRDTFPDLDALTREIEEQGFESVDDAGWQWQETQHFLRLFYLADKRLQASIALAEQSGLAFSYVSLTSRTADGRTFTTSNYPFSATMQVAPKQHLNRQLAADSFADLMTKHVQFLDKEKVAPENLIELDIDTLPNQLADDIHSQIDHNLAQGLIEPLGEGEFRYSWRGCWFLWLQVVKDMLRV